MNLRALFRRKTVERELESELGFHLDMQIRAHIQAGMTPEEARLQALRDFGGLEQAKESCRDTRGVRLLEELAQDARYGLRLLARRPGFALTAAATLALAIGVNTALFSVVNAALVRPLPYRHGDRLVQAWQVRNERPAQKIPVTPGDFDDWRKHESRSIEGWSAYAQNQLNWTGHGDAVRIWAAVVSWNYLELVGVEPVLGRLFRAEEEIPGRERVSIIGHGLWKSRFGGDPAVLGRTMILDGKVYTVVGVLPARFRMADSHGSEVFLPFAAAAERDPANERYAHFLGVIARLAPGVPLGRAQAEVEALAARYARQYPATNSGWGARLVPLRDEIAGPVRPALGILLAAGALLLLIACANVANLLVAQSVAREREMAVRAALGAGRFRLVRQLVVEGLLLSLGAAAAGLAIAVWSAPLLVSAIPELIRSAMLYLDDLRPDARVLAFTIGLAILTTLLSSLAPALASVRQDWLRSRTGAPRDRLRRALVACEAGLAVILLVGAGLAARSVARVLEVRPGFNPERMLTLRVSLPQHKYGDRARLAQTQREAVARLSALTGVRNAVSTTVIPLSGFNRMSMFGIAGRSDPPWRAPSADYWAVSPSFFTTLGVPVLAGRAFAERDNETAPKVAIINDTLARNYFANENPVGKYIVVWRASRERREIVGVSGDVRNSGLDLPPRPLVLLPAAQDPLTDFSLLIKTPGDPAALAGPARSAILDMEKDAAVYGVKTMDEVVAGSPTLALRRVPTLLMGVLAAAALVLAAVGLGGLMSSLVGQRTREIGIRMALGAAASGVRWMILGHSVRLILAGMACGMVLAVILARLLKSWLFGVTALDAITYFGAMLLLAAVTLAATWLPARRATRIDPAAALRLE